MHSLAIAGSAESCFRTGGPWLRWQASSHSGKYPAVPMRKPPKDLVLPPPEPRVIVGFDSEWTLAKKGENRILSYQLVVLNADTGATSDTFLEPTGPTRRHRISLGYVLSMALNKARSEGVIPLVPTRLIVAAHFARADITTLRDFDAMKRRLTAVRKSYATTGIPLTLKLATPTGQVACNVRLVDTAFPDRRQHETRKSLERISDCRRLPCLLAIQKTEMDLFLVERRDEFVSYAMTDARASRRCGPPQDISKFCGSLGGGTRGRDARRGKRPSCAARTREPGC